MSRLDGRDNLATRPISLNLNVLTDVVGSVSFGTGTTNVIATVRGPTESTNPRRSFIDGACIRVTVEHNTKEAEESSSGKCYLESMERTIEHLLYSLVKVEDYPSTVINVVLVVLNDDGGLMACMVNAAVSAVLYAGLPLKRVALAACVGIVGSKDEDLTSQQLSGILADPSKDDICHSVTFVCDFHSQGVLLCLPEDGYPMKVDDYGQLYDVVLSHVFPQVKSAINATFTDFAKNLTSIIEVNNY